MEVVKGVTKLKITKEEEKVLSDLYSAIINGGYEAAIDNLDAILHAIAYGDAEVFDDFQIEYELD